MKIKTNGPVENITVITGIAKKLVNVEILSGPSGSSVSQPDKDYDNAFIWSDNALCHDAVCYHLSGDCTEVWCDGYNGNLDHDDIYIGFTHGDRYYTAILTNGTIKDVQYKPDCQADKPVMVPIYGGFN
jgi:hypothetical protein